MNKLAMPEDEKTLSLEERLALQEERRMELERGRVHGEEEE